MRVADLLNMRIMHVFGGFLMFCKGLLANLLGFIEIGLKQLNILF